MSYPQARGIRIVFTAGLSIAGAFALLYACMISGLFANDTGRSIIMWNAIGTTGLIHTMLFVIMWIGGCCGWWNCGTYTIKIGVFMWVLISVLMTAVGASSNGALSTFIYYGGVTTLVHVGIFLAAVGVLLVKF